MCGCNSNFDGSKKLSQIKQRRDAFKERFSSFKGSLPKPQPVINVKNYGIDEEEYFSYNPKHRGGFSNFVDNRGFKHSNELGGYDF